MCTTVLNSKRHDDIYCSIPTMGYCLSPSVSLTNGCEIQQNNRGDISINFSELEGYPCNRSLVSGMIECFP